MERTEERWIPTVCNMCYAGCVIKARRNDGIVIELKGHEESPNSLGKMCAKGKAGIMGLYDPYRITKPLKRTNPAKGIEIDPKWTEISWDEALDTVVEKLKKTLQEDPRKVESCGLDFHPCLLQAVFGSALGIRWLGLNAAHYFCGNILHLVHYLLEGAFFAEPDFDRCNYCILVGCQEGFMVNKNCIRSARRMADARERGMKLVVVDPVMSTAAAKADEWVPIRPGTDGAFALSFINVLLNELGIYDKEFIKNYTNGPYLVGPEGSYVREKETGKPLVWDMTTEKAMPYDDPNARDLAIEGVFNIQDQPSFASFQLLKDYVKNYSPERASDITTVPAETIRRIAQEYGQAARVGSTVRIEGKELPFRPAALNWTRGSECHKHGTWTGIALQLINIVLGAIDVPGGALGNRTVDRTVDIVWPPLEGPDGLIVPGGHPVLPGPFPARKARRPENINLADLFPIASASSPQFEEAMLNPEKYGIDYRPEFLFHFNSNMLMTTSNPERLAQVLTRIPFMVSFAIHLNETVQLADIVLPDVHYLETFSPFPHLPLGFVVGEGEWYRYMAQPVAEGPEGVRPVGEVLLEIADRAGILPDFYQIMNNVLSLKKPFRLDPDKKYNLEEIGDIWAKSWCGPEHGVEWFREHGVFLQGKRTVEEVYPRPFIKGRMPIYQEYFIAAGHDLKNVTLAMGLSWDTADYRALPEWMPCPAYEDKSPDFDLYAVNYRLPIHTFSTSMQNPYLCELGEHHPSAHKILINTETARKKGIKDGNAIWLTSIAGKVKGTAKLTEGIHPEVVGIAGAFGHWSDGMPVAKGKGTHFNTLLPSTLDRIDMLAASLDSCVRVKVSKA